MVQVGDEPRAQLVGRLLGQIASSLALLRVAGAAAASCASAAAAGQAAAAKLADRHELAMVACRGSCVVVTIAHAASAAAAAAAVKAVDAVDTVDTVAAAAAGRRESSAVEAADGSEGERLQACRVLLVVRGPVAVAVAVAAAGTSRTVAGLLVAVAVAGDSRAGRVDVGRVARPMLGQGGGGIAVETELGQAGENVSGGCAAAAAAAAVGAAAAGGSTALEETLRRPLGLAVAKRQIAGGIAGAIQPADGPTVDGVAGGGRRS